MDMKPCYIGNVHEVYQLSDNKLVIVSTDRMSVHGKIIPWLIRDKGVIQTKISNFWFNMTTDIIPNHIISTNIDDMPSFFHNDYFRHRTVMVKKLKIIPYEFIVRGYMFGRLWKSYQRKEAFCRFQLIDKNYHLAEKLDQPIVTPTIKLDHNRDVDVDMSLVEKKLGKGITEYIYKISILLYERCCQFAASRGIIIADTKLEFGVNDQNELILADEIFTPDSSRFWDSDDYQIGVTPRSYDKQLLRDWLSNHKVQNQYQYEQIPYELIDKTEKIYADCYKKLLL